LDVTLFEAYPNPFSQQLLLSFPSNSANAQFVITDAAGRIMEDFIVNAGQTAWTFNTSEWSNGMYVLRCQSQEGVVAKAFLKN